MIFLIFSFLLLSTTANDIPKTDKILCNFESCTQPIDLLIPAPPNITITAKVIQAEIVKIPQRLVVHYHRVKRYRATCEFAIFHEDSRDCTTDTTNVLVGKSTVKSIAAGGPRKIGKICDHPDTCEVRDCENADLSKSIYSDRRFTMLGKFFRNRFSSTCLMDWETETYNLETHALLKYGEQGARVVFSDKVGKIHEINPTNEYYDVTADGFEIYVDAMATEYETGEVKCLSREKKSFCLVTKSTKVPLGTVYQMVSSTTGITDSSEILLSEPMDVESHNDLYETNLGTASSLGDVISAMHLVVFEQLQSQFNAVILAKEVNELRVIISEMIKLLSQSNPALIGHLSRKKSFTRWVGINTFVQCPCADFDSEVPSGLCKGKYIYDVGLWRLKEPEDSCYMSYNKSGTKSWTPFSDASLSLEMVNIPELISSLNDQIIAEHDNSMFDHIDTGDVKERGFFDILGRIYDFILPYYKLAFHVSVWVMMYVKFFRKQGTNDHVTIEMHDK